jgi:hypothetical protein
MACMQHYSDLRLGRSPRGTAKAAEAAITRAATTPATAAAATTEITNTKGSKAANKAARCETTSRETNSTRTAAAAAAAAAAADAAAAVAHQAIACSINFPGGGIEQPRRRPKYATSNAGTTSTRGCVSGYCGDLGSGGSSAHNCVVEVYRS